MQKYSRARVQTHTHTHQMASRVDANLCAAQISALGIKTNEKNRKAFEDLFSFEV